MENQMTILAKSEQTPVTHTRNNSYASQIFEVLQSLRKKEVFCDITLVSKDDTKVRGHKVILASACPYFRSMFKSCKEENNDSVTIKEFDSTVLKLIVDYIYSGQILLTQENVQDLLEASTFLQLLDIQDACCEFFKNHLHPTNCLSTRALANLYSCMGLLSISESFIKQNFLEVIKSNEFLSLSFEQVVKLISTNDLTVTSEENVFECIICWVNHAPSSREEFFHKLLEHVRLPLLSVEYLFKTVAKEPLIKNKLECLNNLIDAFGVHLLKYDEPEAIQNIIFTTPRRPISPSKGILVIGGLTQNKNKYVDGIEWYDPVTDRWQSVPNIPMPSLETLGTCYVALKDIVFAMGSPIFSPICTVEILNLASTKAHWVSSASKMLVKRTFFGVTVLNNCIYAIGGVDDGCHFLKSTEVFDCSSQKWKMVSSMSTGRCCFGVGVLDNLIYAVGGSSKCFDGDILFFKFVERYDPYTDIWSSVANMNECRNGVGVGILDGLLYAVGGNDIINIHKSVEVYNPKTGVWTYVAEMHSCRTDAGVVVLNGLLYVVGGTDGTCDLASVEVYNPHTNIWTILASMNIGRSPAGVLSITKSPHFNT